MLANRINRLGDGGQALLRLVRAWACLEEAGAELAVVREGIDPDLLAQFSARTGLEIPRELALLYEQLGGFAAVEGAGVELHGWPPVAMSELGVDLRDADEPAQLRWFGGNAGSELYGVWLPRAHSREAWAPAIASLEMTPDSCVVATSGVVELLIGLTIVGLQDDRPAGTDAALDALTVPDALRRGNPDDPAFLNNVASWVDPVLGYRGWFGMQPTHSLSGIVPLVRSLARA